MLRGGAEQGRDDAAVWRRGAVFAGQRAVRVTPAAAVSDSVIGTRAATAVRHGAEANPAVAAVRAALRAAFAAHGSFTSDEVSGATLE